MRDIVSYNLFKWLLLWFLLIRGGIFSFTGPSETTSRECPSFARRKETRQFCNQIVAKKEARETPIICINGVSYLHTTNGDITLVATSRNNCNAAMIVQFLYSLVNLCKAYFGGEFDEN